MVWLSDRFGRKKLRILAAFLFTVTGVLTALAPTFSFFVANRLLGGVAIGLASNLSPMYIAEISPAAVRGKFVSVNQLTIVIGILAAQLTNWLIARPVPPGAKPADILASWNGQTGWRWMFGAEAVPAFLFFLLMFLVPESPRWQVKNGRAEAARKVLGRVGGPGFAAEALADIRATLGAGEIPGPLPRAATAPGATDGAARGCGNAWGLRQSWPVAETSWQGRQLRIWQAEPEGLAPRFAAAAPGEVVESAGGRIVVATGDGALRLARVQVAGRRAMTAAEFLNAQSLAGARLG